MKQKYFWFDLDGTLRQTKDGKIFIDSPDNQEPMPGTREAVEYFAINGFRIIGITNQGGCTAIDPATGQPRKSLEDAITEQQVTLNLFPKMEKILFCPSYSSPSHCYEVTRASAVFVAVPIGNSGGEISCRKPGHGMILASVRDDRKDVNWGESWMVGDRDEDQLCAAGAVIKFVWADLFRSYFSGEQVEKPQQPTRTIQEFEALLSSSFRGENQ
jgi:D-glycero-D-manno-heptose 1,7-bisphosphate phosphatase